MANSFTYFLISHFQQIFFFHKKKLQAAFTFTVKLQYFNPAGKYWSPGRPEDVT